MKPKLLQNSKGMLSRSFNPIKCKTSLRLAGSRLKLLRNKKEVQVKKMKTEIAHLLESGHDQTAQIRVEHVIREEKMTAAYDLLEIYCELIIARLPIIESQKDCPIDLKEAIASIVFSSPRCGDVPELLDVRKQFSAKYGKEFITAATELRLMCGVGRLLVEKLSASAPDGPTKIKILNAIADEHNVKWDYKSAEEKESVSGPTPIRNESQLHSETPRFEAAVNLAQQDAKVSLGEEKQYSVQPEARPPGEKMSQLFQGDLDSQKWNMEFKDAASASQAAAESAERASMAARAAAQLSSHGRILTTQSPKSDDNNLKAQGLEGLPHLNSFKNNIEESASMSSSVESAQIDPMTSSRFEESGGGGGSEEYSGTGGDDSLYHGFPFADDYIQKNSLKEESEGEMDMKRESETEAENLRLGKIVKQKSLSISDDVNILANLENEDPFTSISAPHESDSEVDDHGPDKGPPTYGEQDMEFHLAQKSVSVKEDSWSPRSSPSNVFVCARENSSSDVYEKATLRDNAELDNFAPVTFDEDMNGTGHESVRSEFQDKTGHESDRSPRKMEQHLEIDDSRSLSEDEDFPWETNQVNIFDADSSEIFFPEKPEDESKEDIVNEEPKLNFGKLTGGFRHKGHNHLPFFRSNNSMDVSSTATTITSSTVLPSVEHPKIVTTLQHKKTSGKQHLSSESEEEEILQPKNELSFGASSFYSDDSSDLDEDFPKVSLTSKSHLQSGISRRTKASPSSSGTNSALDSNGMDTKNATASGKLENCEQPISGSVASLKSDSGKASYSTTIHEPKISTALNISSNKVESPKKATHVHPKLPDYDALVQSLRINTS